MTLITESIFSFMEYLIWMVFAVILLVLYSQYNQMKSRIWDLEKRIRTLEENRNADNSGAGIAKKTAKNPTKALDTPAPSAPSAVIMVGKTPVSSTPVTIPNTQGIVWKSRMATLEKIFMENYTGLLGGAILILGIVFLAVFGALKLSAPGRILLLLAGSGVLYAEAWILERKNIFANSSIWVRSAGASMVLFTLYAAGHIPGLKIIESSFLIYVSLVSGILFAMASGFLSAKMSIFTLHYVYSITALAATGTNLTTLFIAMTMGFLGQISALCIKDKNQNIWTMPLITGAHLIYLFFWFMTYPFPESSDQKPDIHIWIFVHTFIWFSASPVLWIKSLQSVSSSAISRPMAWTIMLVSLILGGDILDASAGISLAWGGYLLLAFLSLVLTARRWKNHLLDYHAITDYIFLFAFLSLSVFRFYESQLNDPFRYLLLVGITSFFVIPLRDFPERHRKSAVFLDGFISAVRLVFAFLFLTLMTDEKKSSSVHLILVAVAGGILLSGNILRGRFALESSLPIGFWKKYICPDAFALGFILYSFMYASANSFLSSGSLLLGLATLSFYYYWAENNNFNEGKNSCPIPGAAIFSLALVFPPLWYGFFHGGTKMEIAINGLLFFLPTLFLLWVSLKKNHPSAGIFLMVLTLHFSIMIPALWENPDILSMGFLLLFLLLMVIQKIPGFKDKMELITDFIFYAAYIPLAFFLFHWGVFYTGDKTILIGIIASGIVLAGHHLVRTEKTPVAKPLSEIAFLILLKILLWDMPKSHQTPGLAFLTLAAYIYGLWQTHSGRFTMYSIMLHLITVFYILFSGVNVISGGVAISIQIVYLVLFHKAGGLGDQTALSFLPIGSKENQNAFVSYIFFLSLGIYIWQQMGSTLLTLAWIAEAFLIFLFGQFSRAAHFRYSASILAIFCIVRLTFWDLDSADTLTRALVFIGTGALLLAMNILYQRNKTGNTDEQKNERQ